MVHMCDDYVVVNKPADVLCMRHTSNAVEEVAWCVAKAIKSPGLEVRSTMARRNL